MRFGVGCLGPINTTVIASEEEWARAGHRGTLTLACTPKYVGYKSNRITQAHARARTGELTRPRRRHDGGRKLIRREGRWRFLVDSIQTVAVSACVSMFIWYCTS